MYIYSHVRQSPNIYSTKSHLINHTFCSEDPSMAKAEAEAEAEADTSSSTSDTLTGSSKLRFSEDEETLINRMFNLVGQRWGLIAGRIPGRTAEEIEKYWTSRYYQHSQHK